MSRIRAISGRANSRSERQREAPPERAGEGQYGQCKHGATAMATPKQPPGGALGDAYEKESDQEPDGGGESMALEGAAAVGLESHDQGNLTAQQQVSYGGQGEHSEPYSR